MSESAGSAAEAPQPEAAADTNNHETHQRQRQEEAHRAGAAAAAAAATVTMMDVEIPALPPADGDGGLPPLGADDETEAAAAAAATAAATAAAAAAPVPVPVQAVSFFAVRPPMGPADSPSDVTSWGIFPTQAAAEAYAATFSPTAAAAAAAEEAEGEEADSPPPPSSAVRSFSDAMSAIVYASRGTVVISRRKKKRKKRDAAAASEDGQGGFTAVYKGGSGAAAAPTGRSYAPETKRRKPYKQWEDQYQKVVALKERTGGFKISSDNYPSDLFPSAVAADEEEVDDDGTGHRPKRNSADKLRRWMSDQRAEYKLYQTGAKSSMTEEKIVRLQRIGFDWDTAPMPIGRPKMDAADASAAAGGVGAAEDADPGRAPRGSLTEDDRRRAKHLRKRPPKPLSAEKKAEWDRMYGEFLSFQEQHGHANVNTSDKSELAKWVSKQRYEYKLLKEGRHSHLTTTQLMKLQDAGFVFAPRGSSYLSWTDRLEQLRAFKAEKGHLKIPVNHPELGSFVKAQRESHRRRVAGEETNMTDERYSDLLELGFVFEAGKRHIVPRGPTKTWEERFEDLLTYREEFGHCNVPQHYPGLGYWVHAQRNGYRMLKEGKKTAMTHEKALKLADAGFQFDAKKGKRKAGEGGGSGGDHEHVVGAGAVGAANMNAAVGLAMAGHVHHHHVNPPPLGGHLAAHHLAGYHYDGGHV